ncbi:hypothetical protein WDW89_26140 [Deltaproteobacteria bacterium TL4]
MSVDATNDKSKKQEPAQVILFPLNDNGLAFEIRDLNGQKTPGIKLALG